MWKYSKRQLLERGRYWLLRLPFLNYERIWTFLSLSPGLARYYILNVQDEETFAQRGKEDADRLKEYITPNAVVLDFGCGIGRVDKYSAPLCKELHVADISRTMLWQARRRLKHFNNIFYHKLNGGDLRNFPEGKFDFVFSIAVFQHLEKEEAYIYLAEIFRVLKAGGHGYFHFLNFLNEHNFAYFADYARNHWKRSKVRCRYHTMPEIQKMLETLGFQIRFIENNYSIVVIAFKPE